MVMITPGVYSAEKNAFPNSIVAVPTAVPAFIGYTEFARDRGKSIAQTPWRIASLAEFEQFFGGPPTGLVTFSITEVGNPASGSEAGNGSHEVSGSGTGGTVGTLPVEWSANVPLARRDADVLASAGGRSKYTLRQTGGFYLLYHSLLHFFQNGGGPCHVVSTGTYQEGADTKTAFKAEDFLAALETLKQQAEPTLIVAPEVVLLAHDDCFTVQGRILDHCGLDMKNRFAILDIWEGYWDDGQRSSVSDFRDKLDTTVPSYGAAYFPWLNTSILSVSDLGCQNLDTTSWDVLLQALIDDLDPVAGLQYRANPTAYKDQSAPRPDPNAKPDPIWSNRNIAALLKYGTKPSIDPAAAAGEVAKARADQVSLDKLLRAISPFFNAVLGEMLKRVNILPPSPAMAGLYAQVDNQRGVWKAPANVAVSGVVSPTLNISAADQEDLNVTPQGKSINAIRSFVGEGTLVWGARTLDGNSLDWRYVSVRRTLIMLQESVKLELQAMVFEPNVAETWVAVKGMITNFLTSIWKQGGLAGAVPEDAFSVSVGLGDTMTQDDVVKGILRVTVLVAASHPAEFIEITFQQQLQNP